MREAPPKPVFPSTLPAAHAEIKKLARNLRDQFVANRYLEEKVVELATKRVTLLGVRPSEIPNHPLITKINA